MLTIGRYRARKAETKADLTAAQELRALAFLDRSAPPDEDEFDRYCTHIVVHDQFTNQLVCCFRMLLLPAGDEVPNSYSAQFYDLSALETFPSPIAEIGRFCLHPEARNADILRVAWAGMARYVDENSVRMVFGCSSFKGTNPDMYLDAFDLLMNNHLAPERWRPGVKSSSVFRFAEMAPGQTRDRRAGLRVMPPLLRSYLGLGGWVSDHAVIDPLMNTLHVFTGLEVADIPAKRKQVLRAVADHGTA